MAYTPVDWVDGVTPVNAANLDHLETGVDQAHDDIAAANAAIATKQSTSEKGAANGYAALDSAGRVAQQATVDKVYSVGQVDGYIPIVRSGVTVWEPVPAGGADLVYNGAYPAATPYTDGDIVIHNGIAYLCVRSTSAAPTPWAGARGPISTYGTALPSSPVNGDEHILVDSLTAPTYAWRMRYNASATSSSKWEFVGGTPWMQTVNSADASGTPINTWRWFVNGPFLNTPVAGVYDIRISARLYAPGGADVIWIAPGIAPNTQVTSVTANITASGGSVGAVVEARTAQLAAAVQMGGHLYAGRTDSQIIARTIAITPVRLG